MNPIRRTPNVLVRSSEDAAVTASLMAVRTSNAKLSSAAGYQDTMRTA